MCAESRDWRRGRARARPSSSPRPPPAPQAPKRPPRPDAAPVRGTFAAMCSDKERRDRAKHKEISRFERLDGGDNILAVKKYRRAAAGSTATLEPDEVRPPRVLLETLRHLFLVVVPWQGGGLALEGNGIAAGADTASAFLSLYEFLSDRVRSVRQDFTVQHVEDASLETALEQIARFYVLAGLRADQLLGRSASDGSGINWSDKLHEEQLASALAQLQELFRVQHSGGGAADLSDAVLDRQASMVALDLLLRLDDARGVALTLRRLPIRLRARAPVRRALGAFVALQLDDFRGFFGFVEAMTVLEQALALRQLPRVWGSAVRMLNKAFGKQDRVGLAELGGWLWLTREGEDLAVVEQLCGAMNVHVEHAKSVQPTECVTKSPPVDSWEDQGSDLEVGGGKKLPLSAAVVRFKVNALHAEMDAKEAKKLVRSVALRRVLEREAASGKSAGELVVDGEV